MISKVLSIAILVAVVAAQREEYGHHGHGPARSSVHITRHHGPEHRVHLPHSHGHHHGHGRSQVHITRHDGPVHQVVTHDRVEHGRDEHGHGHIDYHAHPKYEYEYKVDDHHTGDHKEQQEQRDGDVVKGRYSLHQPDGSIRHVEYYADKTGFHADVKYTNHHHHSHH